MSAVELVERDLRKTNGTSIYSGSGRGGRFPLLLIV
jgi:hypothetical protein